jgi:acetyl esterase/lipase
MLWVSGARGNPSRMEHELALKLQDDRVNYLTQVEIPVTTADFYFPLESRPLIVFVHGPVHMKTTQMTKDEELRTLLRKRGCRILELSYSSYTDRKRDELYRELMTGLGR